MEMSEVPTKPRPAPRPDQHHQQRHLGVNTMAEAVGYSSSEGEEEGLTAGCEECEECARNQAVYNVGTGKAGSLQYGSGKHRGRTRSGRDKHGRGEYITIATECHSLQILSLIFTSS